MSNLWINWRFGCIHIQIGPDKPYFEIVVNQYHKQNKPKKWFEMY